MTRAAPHRGPARRRAHYRRGMPTRPALRRCALLVLAVLTLTGCLAPRHQATAPTSAASSGTTDPALARFYDQVLEWTTCGEEQCADATVPLDWSDPEGDTIEIALRRVPASGGSPVPVDL